MTRPNVDDRIQLTQDLPEFHLNRGEIGIVRSMWCAPLVAYEVEFHPGGVESDTRAMVMPEQLQMADASDAQAAVL